MKTWILTATLALCAGLLLTLSACTTTETGKSPKMAKAEYGKHSSKSDKVAMKEEDDDDDEKDEKKSEGEMKGEKKGEKAATTQKGESKGKGKEEDEEEDDD